MSVTELTRDNFNDTIDGNDIVVIDFWAEWCAPCKSFAPVFEAVAERHPDLVFGKIDTDAQGELAQAFQIRSIPTLALFREQIRLFSGAGALSEEQLEELVQKAIALDMEPVRAQISKPPES